MVTRNKNMEKLRAGYLFPEIGRQKKLFMEKNPDAKIISLGVGDTTEPLTPTIVKGLKNFSEGLGTKKGYIGYGEELGMTSLREKIATELYKGVVSADDVFISDGAKPDTTRLQVMFGSDVTIAVQDPSYPVYVDTGVMLGQTGEYDEKVSFFKGITYMRCDSKNNFFPDLAALERTDLIFFCNPNNPTGAVATKHQLQELVNFAKKNKSIIIYDSAYAQFIKEENLSKQNLVRSIFEIQGAREVAIEVSSFSKLIGYTGVRLGWTIVPEELKFDDRSSVKKDWNRIINTCLNGASNIAQAGGIAALSSEGQKEMQETINFYMGNAKIIRESLKALGYELYGGINSPYVWTKIPGMNSWDAFNLILQKSHVVTTPGEGFGPGGEGFVRFSAFGSRDDVVEACERLKKLK